jgi:ABC-type transport system involved in cytochrome c biogenesis permease subunit
MVAREGAILDYKSRLVVFEDKRPVTEKVIEVNDPLHHGGYHFYQHSYDAKNEQYTVLFVKSDSGLWPVYAGFALLCAGTFWLMWVRRGEKGPISLERAAYRIVCLGFPLLTLGLVLGCIWGKIAWGDYWNWDPKELWSLISWLVFLGYLHVRYMYGKRYPRLNSSLVVTGLVAIVLTLLWVNLSRIFGGGLHSYSGSSSALEFKATALGLLIMLAMAAYAAAMVTLLFKLRKLGSAVFGLGCALTATAFVVRWVQVGHVPMQNLFEVFLCMGLVIYPISVLSRRFLQVGGEAFDALLGFVVLFPAAFVFGAEPQRLPPALQSWLFAPHVGTYMLSYVILAKAAVQAFGQLFTMPDQSWAAPAS